MSLPIYNQGGAVHATDRGGRTWAPPQLLRALSPYKKHLGDHECDIEWWQDHGNLIHRVSIIVARSAHVTWNIWPEAHHSRLI